MRGRILGAVVAAVCAVAMGAAQGSGLRIVVIGGEDGVNIVGKGTAAAPVVEVRDRNDLPVAGASVLFLLGGNNARFAGNASRLAVTTDQSGRATATGLQAVGKGAVRIQVQASFQGETATATVTQANFANVAEAAQAGKSITNTQPGANGASQTAAQGSHHLGLIAAGAAAAAGGVIAKSTLSDDAAPGCLAESESTSDAVQAFIAAADAYRNCLRASTPAACGPQQSAAAAAGQRFVDAGNTFCFCQGLTSTFTVADANAYIQSLVAGSAGLATFNCRSN